MLRYQRGFTLIEMSIVLVIIGLIVGGILKGQELIESSRQKNLISQIDRIKSSTTTFVDRFKGLPGDFNRVALLPNSALLTGGNDNGVVGAISSNTTDLRGMGSTVQSSENTQYFNHLVAANLGSGGSVAGTGVTISCFAGLCATSSPLPPAAFPQSGLTLHYGTHEGGTAGGGTAAAKQVHWLLLSRFLTAGTLGGGSTDGAVSPERAFQIDNKYDDGNSGAGNIRSTFIGTGCGVTGTDYTPTVTDVNCHLLFSLE